MLLVQRSGDMLTASGPGGINEIQYAAFLMMIARHTGYEPGVFSHVVANEQIYDRHLDAANQMLSLFSARDREEFVEWVEDETIRQLSQPRLVLNPEKTNFYDMTIDDFTMKNYNPIKPQLRLELGI